jgi:zinc protease
MLDRIHPPQISIPSSIEILEPQKLLLKNGTPVYNICAGTQEVVKIELIFAAGNIASTSSLIATATNDLMDEGSLKHNSSEIAEALDYYGAYLHAENGADWSSISLFSLNKFVNETLPYFQEIITQPLYPAKEIQTYKQQGKQRLSVNLTKVDYLARIHFSQTLFGQDHPYGRITQLEEYDMLDTAMLKDYHEKKYKNGLRAVVISGLANEDLLKKIISALDSMELKNGNLPSIELNKYVPLKKFIEKSDAIQSAIRIGRRMFTRHHPDFIAFSVLNTILGGYFGSRLMANIREDKGYTYGIGSGLVSNDQDGYFFITTEVGADVREAAVKEIYHELHRLRTEDINNEELTLVKNYLTGAFQRSIDGPFALAEKHKMLTLNNLNIKYLNGYLGKIKALSATHIKEVANLYLKDTDLSEIVVGK